MRSPATTSLLVTALLLCCAASTVAADRQRVRIVLSFRGPCYPVANSLMADIISSGLNPLTGYPWGNQQQSGGFASVCTKAGVSGCEGGSASSRRLLANSVTACSNKYWYLYLDTTQPQGSSTWPADKISKQVKDAIAQGQLQSMLATTNLGAMVAGTVTLKYIDTTTVPDAPPSPAATASPSTPTPSSSSGGSSTSSSPSSSSSDSSSSSSGVKTSSVAAGSPADGSSGKGGRPKWLIPVAVVGGVVALAVVSGTVAAVKARRQTMAGAKLKVTADLEAFRERREKSRDASHSSKAGGRFGPGSKFDTTSPASPSFPGCSPRRRPAYLGSASGAVGAATIPRAAITLANRAPEPEGGAELDSVLDPSAARSSQPEFAPEERPARFKGLRVFTGRS